MSQSLTHCPLCQGTNSKVIFTQTPYSIRFCAACRQGWLDPQPCQKELDAIYSPQSYFDDKQTPDGLVEARRKLNALTDFVPLNSSILDFGCGTGHFIQAAAKQYHLYGFDVSAYAAKIAKTHTPYPVKSGVASARSFPPASFDAILLFDVIEHLPDFDLYLKWFHTWLKPDGYLIFTTPDLDSLDAKLMGRHWYGFTKIPQHLHYFSRTSVSKLLPKTGFNLTTTKPWGFSRSLSYLVTQIHQEYRFPLNLKRHPHLTHYFDRLTLTLPLVDFIAYAKKVNL